VPLQWRTFAQGASVRQETRSPGDRILRRFGRRRNGAEYRAGKIADESDGGALVDYDGRLIGIHTAWR
jgi:hypothetical protein